MPKNVGPGQLNNNESMARAFALHYVFPVSLPVVTVITSFIAAVNHGSTRVYWSLGAIAATFTTGLFGVIKDRGAITAREQAVTARTELATALTKAGQPVVVLLSQVTAAGRGQDVQSAVAVLRNRIVALAQTQAGRQSGIRCETRSVLYEFDKDGNLQRGAYEGRPVDVPRQQFRKGRGEHEDEAIRFALGERALLVQDLVNHPPPHFADSQGRSYKAFVSVPIRIEKQSFGFLSVDSDQAYSLTEIDQGYLILLAGVLAAGLAHEKQVNN